ncbi:hypothetical protein JCM19239_6239 [Vibrio variabilis]|uniref:Uncharacterized protein n=1 Tax=Vibrio variabilis TaxID=990271 RepID=A0ABQ0J979_9VIBR|nr:hypothetical protein JCM19239_6239 [Vibrio variabilis]
MTIKTTRKGSQRVSRSSSSQFKQKSHGQRANQKRRSGNSKADRKEATSPE